MDIAKKILKSLLSDSLQMNFNEADISQFHAVDEESVVRQFIDDDFKILDIYEAVALVDGDTEVFYVCHYQNSDEEDRVVICDNSSVLTEYGEDDIEDMAEY